MNRKNTGFTLMEVLMVVALLTIMSGVMVYVFRAVLIGWSGQEKRAGSGIAADLMMRRIEKDVREAVAISDHGGKDEIRFALKQRVDPANPLQASPVLDYYIYYFYNPGDSYPLKFNQSLYQLRKAQLDANMTSAFVYGSGDFVAEGIVPPSVSDLSVNNQIVTIDLTVTRGDQVRRERIRAFSKVMPRNLDNK
jgi:prepilin-type N-terminal cleavage/methylation domain-containing protein